MEEKDEYGKTGHVRGTHGRDIAKLGLSAVGRRRSSHKITAMRVKAFYRAYLDAKFWFKNSSLGRSYLGPLTGEQIDNTTIATDPAAQRAQVLKS